MRKSVLASVLGACVLWVATPAQADTITFNANGTGGAGVAITTFDPSPGNSISIGLNASSTLNSTGLLLFQASVGAIKNVNVSAVNVGGLGQVAFNVVAGVQEQITGTLGVNSCLSTLCFSLAPGSVPNFFDIYAAPVVAGQTGNGNDLTGAGFTAGTLILSGTFTTLNSVFGVTPYAAGGSLCGGNLTPGATGTAASPCQLDQTGPTQDYPNTTTILGGGSVTNGLITVNFFNPNYFTSGLTTGSSFIFATSQETLPFGTVDPSACFFFFTASGTPSCGAAPGSGTLGVGSVGTENGFGNNTMFATDASLDFHSPTTVVPEPASLTLLGLGLVGGATRLRKRFGRQ